MELDNYLPEKAKIHSAAIEECFAGGMIKKDVPLKAYPALASYLYSKDNISYAADLFDLSPANAFTPENMITAGRCFLENQVPSKAFKWFKGAYYLSFNKAEAAKELAGFYKSIGQPRQGLELIENLEKGRLFKELILIKAELCENLFLFDRAAEIYASGFSLFNNPFFLARAGQACVKNKNFLKAMDYFKMAHFQGDTKAPYRYVEAAVKEGLYAGAQDFIEKNPENFVTNESDLKRLELVLRQEDAAGVLTALKEAVSKNAPDEVKKLKQQIRQLDQAARYDSAIKLIDTYLSNGGSDPVLRLTRADLLLKSKRPLEAAEAWLEVLPDVKLTDQGLFKFYQKVAMAYSEAKKHEDAIKYAEKSISLTDGNNVEALNNLARVYGFAGEHKKAEKVLVHASNIAPDSQVTYFNLAMSYYSRNMAESAQRAVKQGLKYGKDGNYTEKLQELLKHLKTFRVVPAAPPKEVIDEKQE
jgi:tetratricopeptide (TPR) repeat protein